MFFGSFISGSRSGFYCFLDSTSPTDESVLAYSNRLACISRARYFSNPLFLGLFIIMNLSALFQKLLWLDFASRSCAESTLAGPLDFIAKCYRERPTPAKPDSHPNNITHSATSLCFSALWYMNLSLLKTVVISIAEKHQHSPSPGGWICMRTSFLSFPGSVNSELVKNGNGWGHWPCIIELCFFSVCGHGCSHLWMANNGMCGNLCGEL